MLDKEVRESVAKHLNPKSEADKKEIKQDTDYLTDLDEAEKASFTGVWDRLGQLRNDIAHCGMRKDQRSAEDAIVQIENLTSILEPLAQQIKD